MAIKASASITLSFMVDVKAVYRYYKLQASTASEPSIPTTNPPSGWTDTEPRYTSGSTNTLYFVDLTVFSNDTWTYSSVSKSSSYEASKEAYNKALNVETTLNEAIGDIEAHTEQLSALQNTGIVNDSTDWDTLESGHYAVYCDSPLSEDNHAPVGAFRYGNLHVIKHIIKAGKSSGNQIYIENAVPPKIYYRSNFDNNFRKWESVTIQSYTDNCVMGNTVDITQYTSADNVFTCPSDGYLALAISNQAAQWINVLINAGGFTFTTGICTPANTPNSVTTYKHVYLRKGMTLYTSSLNKATDGFAQAYFIQFKY